MSARGWKPGDVAMRSYKGHEYRSMATTCYADAHGAGLHWHHEGGGWDQFPVDGRGRETYRPLVVLDPEDREQVERLMIAVDEAFEPDLAPRDDWDEAVPKMQAALREFANPTPPKPAEPTGLGAVVEDAEGKRFVRVGPTIGYLHWKAEDPEDRHSYKWQGVAAVRVLSEGVTPC